MEQEDCILEPHPHIPTANAGRWRGSCLPAHPSTRVGGSASQGPEALAHALGSLVQGHSLNSWDSWLTAVGPTLTHHPRDGTLRTLLYPIILGNVILGS